MPVTGTAAPRRPVVLLAAAVAALLLGGCVSIPQRAWDNGAALGSAHRMQMLYGRQDSQSRRQLYQRADPLVRMQRTVPFQPFGHW
ncbi:MAG TPA: hypothetical protein VGD77_03090 [Gemmatimonadaceae bacterium]